MLQVIVGEDYSFFTQEKDKIKKQVSLVHEYIVDDPTLIGGLVDQFCQDGFFEIDTQLILIKNIFDHISRENLQQVITLVLSYGHSVIVYEYTSSKELKDFSTLMNASFVEQKKVTPIQKISPFAFTDYYLARDKKNAWITFTQLFEKNVALIQIQSALYWALKTLFLVKTSNQESNPEIKPFVYTKMKNLGKQWTEQEIRMSLQAVLSISAQEEFDDDAMRMKFEQLLFAL